MQLELQDFGSYPFAMKIYNAIMGTDLSEQTLIDICCGDAQITHYLNFKEKTYVDILDTWDIKDKGRFVQSGALDDHEVFNEHYSVAFCADGIEHLIKEDGYKLIQRMKQISDKQVFFVPLGDYIVDKNSHDPLAHKSGWWPEDFSGFATIVCPKYHEVLNLGAFYAWCCKDIESDFQRVKNIIAL
jgi:hypothetical protein